MDLTDKSAPSNTTVIPIRFTGSGSEYFRIWIVNLLLIMLTLGVYTPWAKARRLRYFCANTLIDADALGFHGDPKQMFKGWMLFGAFIFIYSLAGNFSDLAGLVALVLLAALWPALWRSSLCFRLGNTSWRGLRLHFAGSLRNAYMAWIPLLLLQVSLAAAALWIKDKNLLKEPEYIIFFILPLAVLVISAPWLFLRIKSYQHNHYVLGRLQTEFWGSAASFYGLCIKPIIFTLSFMGVLALAVWTIGQDGGMDRGSLMPTLAGLSTIASSIFFAVLFLGIGPWFTTRAQNLIWNSTKNSQVRFVSALSFRRMLWLSIKNWALIILTLGLYWPFAKIAMTRLRLEAVHIRSRTRLDALLASAQNRPNEAVGDAAGDFFGLDLGL